MDLEPDFTENTESTEPPKTFREAIKTFCVQYMGGNINEVRNCTDPDCPLYHFRQGKNPYRIKRQLTDEQKERLRKQLAKGRAKQAQKPKGGDKNQ